MAIPGYGGSPGYCLLGVFGRLEPSGQVSGWVPSGRLPTVAQTHPGPQWADDQAPTTKECAMSDETTPKKTAPAPAERAPTKAEAARALKAAGVTVRVPKLGKDGKPLVVTDKDAPNRGTFVVEDRAPTEADILSLALRGESVVAVTVDGRKFIDGELAA